MSQNKLLSALNCQVFIFLTQNNFDFRLRDRLKGKTVNGDRLTVVRSKHQQFEGRLT
jgi:hypothetical protein